MSSDLDQLLKKYPSLKYNDEKTKVVCDWSGHEMPLKLDGVMSYLKGQRYTKLLEKNINQTDLSKYKEHLIPSTKAWGGNMLFCLLTLKHVNKQPHHIQRHLNGRRFQQALKHWLECQEKGIKFVPICKQRFVNEEQNNEVEENSLDDSEAEEMFDMMAMEEDLDTISNAADENNNDQNNGDFNSTVLNENNGKRLKDTGDFDADTQTKSVKRKLDPKLTKKLKVEPNRKKNNKNI